MAYTRQNFINFSNPLTASQLIKIEDALVSKWEKTKINVLGDSITYGVGLEDQITQNLTTHLANWTGAIVINNGISGAKISGSDNSSFWNRFPATSKDANLTIVFGGTNDYWHKNTQIGDLNSTDTNTFCGAINNIISYHCDNNGENELLFVFPFNQSYQGESCETDHGYGTFSQFRDAMKTICSKRGIPFLDLYSESGMDIANNITHKTLFTTDGVHATSAGHLRIAKRIFSKIEYGM